MKNQIFFNLNFALTIFEYFFNENHGFCWSFWNHFMFENIWGTVDLWMLVTMWRLWQTKTVGKK
jgi:hypothetical protein